MNNQVYLVKPTVEMEKEYLDFYLEWKESGEVMIPWVIEKDPTDFHGMIEFLRKSEKGVNLPEGWVPDSTYWLVNGENRVLGAVNIRHALTERLFNSGGHIGYGIRPSERRKGFATAILSLALEKTRKLGIDKVLVVCDATNIASERTILKNGGQQDVSFTEKDGNIVKRYWIEL